MSCYRIFIYNCTTIYNSKNIDERILKSPSKRDALIKEFKSEIAPCRTFCFLHELEALLKNDLIKGGDINNAIVVVDQPVTEQEMSRLAKVFKI